MSGSATLRRALMSLALFAGPLAHADGGRAMSPKAPAAYMQECAACHLAYPPGLLPARSWQRLLTGLDRHYGTDASLDAATVQQIGGWLQSNAGTYKRVSAEPPQDRITRSVWFERKHSGIDPAVWKLASVKQASNCSACHATADRGLFDDDDLRFPAGMSPAMRRSFHD